MSSSNHSFNLGHSSPCGGSPRPPRGPSGLPASAPTPLLSRNSPWAPPPSLPSDLRCPGSHKAVWPQGHWLAARGWPLRAPGGCARGVRAWARPGGFSGRTPPPAPSPRAPSLGGESGEGRVPGPRPRQSAAGGSHSQGEPWRGCASGCAPGSSPHARREQSDRQARIPTPPAPARGALSSARRDSDPGLGGLSLALGGTRTPIWGGSLLAPGGNWGPRERAARRREEPGRRPGPRRSCGRAEPAVAGRGVGEGLFRTFLRPRGSRAAPFPAVRRPPSLWSVQGGRCALLRGPSGRARTRADPALPLPAGAARTPASSALRALGEAALSRRGGQRPGSAPRTKGRGAPRPEAHEGAGSRGRRRRRGAEPSSPSRACAQGNRAVLSVLWASPAPLMRRGKNSDRVSFALFQKKGAWGRKLCLCLGSSARLSAGDAELCPKEEFGEKLEESPHRVSALTRLHIGF